MEKTIRIIALACYIVFGIYDSFCDETGRKRTLKPFLMPLLFLYYLFSAERISPLLTAGLFFCWIGDMFLLRHSTGTFKMGLASFLVGHLFYGTHFLLEIRPSAVPLVCWLFLGVYTAWLLIMKGRLHGHVENTLRNPAKTYMAVIGIASWLAMMRYGSVSFASWITVWIGTLLFCISDNMIAFREWRGYSGRGIMETYLLAQFLIIAGSIL